MYYYNNIIIIGEIHKLHKQKIVLTNAIYGRRDDWKRDGEGTQRGARYKIGP